MQGGKQFSWAAVEKSFALLREQHECLTRLKSCRDAGDAVGVLAAENDWSGIKPELQSMAAVNRFVLDLLPEGQTLGDVTDVSELRAGFDACGGRARVDVLDLVETLGQGPRSRCGSAGCAG